MIPYIVPAELTRTEIEVAKSRFIASLSPAFSVEEARDFIAAIKLEFKDASHHVPAFLIGHGASEIVHCTDAGEPSGTAGRPMLAVLRGSGMGDACVVVVRYFGGIKLGTGGLVRAYSEAVRSVVEAAPRARKTLVQAVVVNYPYSLVERMRRLAQAHHVEVVDEQFSTEVRFTGQVEPELVAPFAAAVQELTNGSVQVERGETAFILRRLG